MGTIEQRGDCGGDDLNRGGRDRGVRRLGFAVKVLGGGGLKDHDGRRWANNPHLMVSIGYLNAIFDYLAANQIRMYRISSNIVPYATHPKLPQFQNQIEECRDELARLGEKARQCDLRLSMHPAQFIVLNSPDEAVARSAVREFVSHAAFLDALTAPESARIVTHVGGVYGDRQAALERFVRRYETLPEAVRRRLVLEHDEISWPVPDVLRIHELTGVPIVFDNLHHAVLNPESVDPQTALRACLATWKPTLIPKIHFSSQRRTDRESVRVNRVTREKVTSVMAPKPGQHADWVDAMEFTALVGGADGFAFDIMLEAKQKDLALLQLRRDLREAGHESLSC